MSSNQRIAEVISIGDEMTSGARLDTNGQWLSRRLGELGIQVAFHTTVGDTLSHNVDVFRSATQRADIIIATGGLGPTRDDLTREALSTLAGQPLELRQDAMDHILDLFSKRNRVMPARNEVQAMFPKGSQQIHNPEGSAPGIDIEIERPQGNPSRIFALPGVPAEMKRMFDETVSPRIMEQGSGKTVIRHLVMKFFGTGESDMEQLLGEMIARDRQPRVGITVSKATISLRITATAQSEESCDQMIATTKAEILERASHLYFGDGEHYEQQHAIVETLEEKSQSLMIVELGHAAPLGDWFAAIDRAPCYHGSVSPRDARQLAKMFTPPSPPGFSEAGKAVPNGGQENIEARDEDFPNSLFKHLKTTFASDWILIVDHYPSLAQEHPGPLPAQQVRFLVCTPSQQIVTETQSMGGHPDVIQPRIAKGAMKFLRSQISRSVEGDQVG